MASYSTGQIDNISKRFNSINKKIEDSINELINSFDYDNLKQLIIDIKGEYYELKRCVAEFSVELRINILEIDDVNVFYKYKKHCELRLKSIYKILEPQDIDSLLNTENEKFLSHADLGKYSYFKVPEILDVYNLSGYLYTYSFMLLVLKKSIIGMVDKLEFQSNTNEDLTIFDEKEISDEFLSAQFKLSTAKGRRIDFIRILHTLYELKFFENKNGQIPTKKEFMLKVGEFFGSNFSSYDSDLSQALNNTSIEQNRNIFNKMIDVLEKTHFSGGNINNK